MLSHNYSTADGSADNITGVPANSESPVASSQSADVYVHLVDRFESRDPAILKTVLLFLLAILSVGGNGISMLVIWKTPKLQTKTFGLLFNLATVDLLNGLQLFWYAAYHLIVYVFNDDHCRYLELVAIMAFIPRYPFYISMNSVGLIAYERYIAIVLPFRYETLVTDRVVKIAVALVWILCLPLTGTFLLLLGHIDRTTCTVTGLVWQTLVTDATCLLTAYTLIILLYGHMLIIALRQQAKINAQVAELQTVAGGNKSAAVAARQKLRTELKAVRLTACVVGAVVVLWTPYLIGGLILISGFNPLLGQYVTDVGSALGSASAGVNWLIYGAASRDFRHSAMQLFGCRRPAVGAVLKSDRSDQSSRRS